jgi:predicted amidohydrolase YtcJ
MAHRLGITSIHDVVTASGWEAYQRARRAGRLSLRVTAMTPSSVAASLAHAGIRIGLGDEWLRIGPVKVFSDGSLGAYTAALDAPYEGRPKERGMLVHPPSELRSILAAAHHAGLQTATHAIGDAAVRLVAETLAEIQEEDPRDPLRHRIEHFELPDEEVLRQARDAGLIASCQPNFVGQWSGPGDLYESRLGALRIQTNNPYRQIARLGIPLCFGSDGMPYGPLYGIHWAVNGYFEDQRLSPVEAFRAYTAGGAHAAFEERTKGTLEPGLWADFVILDGDPFVDPSRIDRCGIRETWIGGDRVFPLTKS